MSSSGTPLPFTENPAPAHPATRMLPWLVAVAFFMESLDTTILNTAVPAVAAALHVGPLAMKAVLASYTLSLAVFIPISGWMADRFGTRRVFASAIGLFTLRVAAVRAVQQHSSAGGVPRNAGHGRSDDGPGGPAHSGALVRQGRSAARDEFRLGSGIGGAHAGPGGGRLDRRLRSLARDLLPQYSHRPAGPGDGLSASARLQGKGCASARFCRAGALRVRHCAAVVRAGGLWRARAERAAKLRACLCSPPRCWRPTGCMRASCSFRCSICTCSTFAPFVSR